MQNLESIHPLVEKLAKKEYSRGGHTKDIKMILVFLPLSVSPELGCMSVVRPWQ